MGNSIPKCPTCGMTVSKLDAKFCSHCGGILLPVNVDRASQEAFGLQLRLISDRKEEKANLMTTIVQTTLSKNTSTTPLLSTIIE